MSEEKFIIRTTRP